jgi:hypothetical protein
MQQGIELIFLIKKVEILRDKISDSKFQIPIVTWKLKSGIWNFLFIQTKNLPIIFCFYRQKWRTC